MIGSYLTGFRLAAGAVAYISFAHVTTASGRSTGSKCSSYSYEEYEDDDFLSHF